MPTNVYGMPKDDLSVGDRKGIMETASGKILDVATNKLSAARGDLVVRDLQPEEDLKLANNYWDLTVSAADEYNNVIDQEIEDGKFIVIYGISVLDANPDTSAIQFSTGARTVQELELENTYAQEQPILYLKSPLLFKENKTLKVNLYSESTGDKNIVLHGFVAELEGEIISPGEAS